MKKILFFFILMAVAFFAFAQSTNKARLKSPSGGLPGRASTERSGAAIPPASAAEIGRRTIRTGETQSLADLAADKAITAWTSSTPSIVTVSVNGDATGVAIGSAFININETEYIALAIVPPEEFHVVSESQVVLLPSSSRVSMEESEDVAEYKTEPTFRLAYRFNNRGEAKGASGDNGGIDILARGENYEWLWTTFYQGGWFYDLNGVMREMVNGYQRDPNGVELALLPEFVYDKGLPYLQVRHILRNTGQTALRGQKFGASADIMMHRNDNASLRHTSYGAYMSDSETAPTLELMFICKEAEGISPVDTLWLGQWDYGRHLNHIYEDSRNDVIGADSAIGFSYQNIDLAANETKEFILRFTLIRNEDRVEIGGNQ